MLEQDLQRATVEFPKPIVAEEAKDLLKYLADKSKADIDYSVRQIVHLRRKYGEDEEYIKEIQGAIRPEDISAMSEFSLNREGNFDIPTRFDAIRFSLVPGYEGNEGPNAKILDVADNTRKIVEQYFRERA